MKRFVVGSVLGSMLAVTTLVNGQENASPKINSPAVTSKDDLAQLIDFLLKNGDESSFKSHLAPAIGLPSAMPVKVETISEVQHGKDKSLHECYLVYEQTPNDSLTQGKRPVCLYIKRQTTSGHDDEAKFFRISLEGQLEKVVMILSKRDNDGKIIPGGSVAREQDIESSETKKEFAAEMSATKKWLKTQQKLLAARSTSPAASAAAASAR